jgi:hypothetical protein
MRALSRSAGVRIIAAGVIVLVAIHAIGLYLFSSRVGLSATVIGGVGIILVLKHVGALAWAYDRLSRRPRKVP